MAETMGDRIREARIARRMSQEDAASEADLSRVTWARLENDEIDNPYLSTMLQVAGALRVSLEALIGEKKSVPRPKM